MPERATDTFTYANGNLATVSAGKFAKLSQYADAVVASNQLKGVVAAEAAVQIAAWAYSVTDHYSQVVRPNIDVYGGPTVMSNGDGAFYAFDVRSGASQIYRVINGGYTALGTVNNGVVPAGAVCYLEIQAGLLISKVDGVVWNTVADGILTSGHPGIRFFDQIALADSWAAGDFEEDPVLPPEEGGAMPTDTTTVWTKKMPALRANQNLDLTTAIMQRMPVIMGSATSQSTDLTTRLRDYYANPANAY